MTTAGTHVTMTTCMRKEYLTRHYCHVRAFKVDVNFGYGMRAFVFRRDVALREVGDTKF